MTQKRKRKSSQPRAGAVAAPPTDPGVLALIVGSEAPPLHPLVAAFHHLVWELHRRLRLEAREDRRAVVSKSALDLIRNVVVAAAGHATKRSQERAIGEHVTMTARSGRLLSAVDVECRSVQNGRMTGQPLYTGNGQFWNSGDSLLIFRILPCRNR